VVVDGPQRHAVGIQADDHLIETAESARPFGHQLGGDGLRGLPDAITAIWPEDNLRVKEVHLDPAPTREVEDQGKTKPRQGHGAAERRTILWGCGAVLLPGRSLSSCWT
jgi:hypothetical protein